MRMPWLAAAILVSGIAQAKTSIVESASLHAAYKFDTVLFHSG